VSLRAQIHAAIDEVAPPDPSLHSEMAAVIHAHAARRPRRLFGLNVVLPVRRLATAVAAALIVVLMIGLVLTGRVWRDVGIFGSAQHTVDQAKLSQLLARPLLLPSVPVGGICPDTPYTPSDPGRNFVGGYGSGPVYSSGIGARFATPSGNYFGAFYARADQGSDPTLVRGRDLETNQAVLFARSPYGKYSGTPIGKVVAVDTVLGQQVQLHAALLLDQSDQSRFNGGWEALQGFANGASGCIGFQVDGFNADGTVFTEVFVISYLL
jgi:hypothetical protein